MPHEQQPKVRINHPYTPALRRSILLALEQGVCGDVEQARVEHRSTKSIADRWERISDEVGIEVGQRRRDRVIVALLQRRHAEYVMLLIAVVMGTGLLDQLDMMRPVRSSRARTQITRTRQPALEWDPDASMLIWPEARA